MPAEWEWDRQARIIQQINRRRSQLQAYQARQRERCRVQIREELAIRFQDEALQRLIAARTKVRVFQTDPVKVAKHEQKLAQILIDIRAVGSMIIKVQETRLQHVIPIELVSPAKLAQYQEERGSVFKVVEKIENDVKVIQDWKPEMEMEKMEEN